MDEGVDPTQMCQSLVDKVSQSKQLLAVSHPEILGLFESWLEELEEEALALLREQETLSAGGLAGKLGLSLKGATFLLSKLKREARK